MIRHGTAKAYTYGGCRCESCSAASRAYANRRRRRIAYGTWRSYVDAQPVRDHLQALSAAGIGARRAAELAGLSPSATRRIVWGEVGKPPVRRCRQHIADAILAVPISDESKRAGAVIDPTGSARRLQALVAIGWSQAKLARALGVRPTNLLDSIHGRRRLTVKRARLIRDLYDHLWNVAPPMGDRHERTAATQARRYALAAGWPPPMAWDDDDLDDPKAKPHGAIIDTERRSA